MNPTTEEIQSASAQTIFEIKDRLIEIQKQQGVFHCVETLPGRLNSVIRQYEDHAASALRAAKEFRDRQLVDLRAMALVLEMVAGASTHAEKNARLRGCLELLNSTVSRLEREEFELSCGRHPHFDRMMLTDYPTRRYVERIHDLERQIDELQKQTTPPETNI